MTDREKIRQTERQTKYKKKEGQQTNKQAVSPKVKETV